MAERNVIRELLVRLGVVGDADAAKRLRSFDQGIKRVARGAAVLGVNLGVAALSAKVLAANLGSRVFQANANHVVRGFNLIEMVAYQALDAMERFDAGLGLLSRRTVENARELERQARALNLTTDEFQQLSFAFREFDLTSEDVTYALTRFGRQAHDALEKAGGASDEARRKFAKLGITAQELADRNPLQVLELVAHKYANAANRDQALAGVYDLLGEDLGTLGEGLARRLVPALEKGAEGITELRRQARDLGLVIDQDLIAQGARLATQWTTLKSQVNALTTSLGLMLVPSVSRFVKRMQDWVAVNQDIIKLRFHQAVQLISGAVERLYQIMSGIDWNLVFSALLTTGAIAQVGASLLGLLATIVAVDSGIQLLRGSVWLAQRAFAMLPPSLGKAAVANVAYAASATAAWLASLPLSSVLGVIAAAAAAVLLPLGGLIFVVDDVITYMRGGRSVLGWYLEFVEEFMPHMRYLPDALGSVGRVLGSTFRLLATLFTEVLAGVLDSMGIKFDGFLDLLKELSPFSKALALFFMQVSREGNNLADSIDQLTASLKGFRAEVSSFMESYGGFFFGGTGVATDLVDGFIARRRASALASAGGPSPSAVLDRATRPRRAPAAGGGGGVVQVTQSNTFVGVEPSQQRRLEEATRRHATEAVREGRLQ